jgi:hypothetical protein
VSLHPHHKGYGGNITEAKYQKGSKTEDRQRQGVEGSNADEKAKEFLNSRPQKRIWIYGFSGTDDAQGEDILCMKPCVGREIIVEEDESPKGYLSLLEWRKSIGRESEGDITMIVEKSVV